MKNPTLNFLLLCLGGGMLLAPPAAEAAETTARWNPRTTNWNVNPRPAIGDWGFDRPGYPPGLYLQGVTVPEGEKVTNPVIYTHVLNRGSAAVRSPMDSLSLVARSVFG